MEKSSPDSSRSPPDKQAPPLSFVSRPAQIQMDIGSPPPRCQRAAGLCQAPTVPDGSQTMRCRSDKRGPYPFLRPRPQAKDLARHAPDQCPTHTRRDPDEAPGYCVFASVSSDAKVPSQGAEPSRAFTPYPGAPRTDVTAYNLNVYVRTHTLLVTKIRA